MKKSLRLIALMLVVIISVFTLASCSQYGSIKADFEEAGYVLQNADNEKTGEIETDDGVITYTVHTFKKNGSGIVGAITGAFSTAIIWEFESDKELTKAMEENEDMMNVLADAQESQLVNGNCFLMTINSEAIELFNASKK